jgi:GNAT superfamily N-acetyltransferase
MHRASIECLRMDESTRRQGLRPLLLAGPKAVADAAVYAKVRDQGVAGYVNRKERRMAIRLLDPRDAAAYRQLRLRALEESPTAFSASLADEAGRSMEEIAARVTPAGDGSKCVFGAFVDAQLAGMLTFVRPTRPKLMHCAEFAGMIVAPEFRLRGIGGALVDAGLAHARTSRGVRQVKLTVNAGNVPARSLYESRGFMCFGTEPDAICVDGVYYDEAFYILRLDTAG